MATEDYTKLNINEISIDSIRLINLNANISIDDLCDLISKQLSFMMTRLEKNSIRSKDERDNLDIDIIFIKRFFEKIEKELLTNG